MIIKYVDKKEIYPAFGKRVVATGEIKIRKDLPKCAIDFLLVHEIRHYDYTEPDEPWLEEELEANWAGLRKHPIGGIVVLWYSVCDWNRWKLYWHKLVKMVKEIYYEHSI